MFFLHINFAFYSLCLGVQSCVNVQMAMTLRNNKNIEEFHRSLTASPDKSNKDVFQYTKLLSARLSTEHYSAYRRQYQTSFSAMNDRTTSETCQPLSFERPSSTPIIKKYVQN